MKCENCPYNLFDDELGKKCCQFGSEQNRGFKAPCDAQSDYCDLLDDLMLEQKEQM